jgi:meso-butanediol dehydrogenase / (S,S)-butanediol dehydrogenase / diacetyl reductase
VSPPRAVIVTGGGTGIGAAVARLLAGGGDRVAIFGRRPGPLRAVALDTGALDVVCDVSDAGQAAAAVGSVADRFGGLDELVLNAGVMRPGGVAELSAADWDDLVAVNLTGVFHTVRAALPHLLAARGAVVAVASIAALRAATGMGGYAVTKAGLAMLTQSLAVDHAHQGLRATRCARAGRSPRWPMRRWLPSVRSVAGIPSARRIRWSPRWYRSGGRLGPRRWPRW